MGLLTIHSAMLRSCTITCSASVCHAILIHSRDYSTETFTGSGRCRRCTRTCQWSRFYCFGIGFTRLLIALNLKSKVESCCVVCAEKHF
jgi:hypothetical protein